MIESLVPFEKKFKQAQSAFLGISKNIRDAPIHERKEQ
jgi:hypothetical protein